MIPVLSEDRGEYKGHDSFSQRKLRLWHKCASLVLKDVRDSYYNPFPLQCADKKVRIIRPVVAAWLGDRLEHEKVCLMVSVSI